MEPVRFLVFSPNFARFARESKEPGALSPAVSLAFPWPPPGLFLAAWRGVVGLRQYPEAEARIVLPRVVCRKHTAKLEKGGIKSLRVFFCAKSLVFNI